MRRDRCVIMTSQATPTGNDHTLAVVIPVCRGEEILPALLKELDGYVSPQVSSAGNRFRVTQVVLVHDAAPDQSDVTIRGLAERYEYVRPVWLARNFGQHAATLAGMSSTNADWIVTMDEDGQHDPAAIGAMLDTALGTRSPLVYAKPINEAPHGAFRNLAGRVAHRAAQLVGGRGIRRYSATGWCSARWAADWPPTAERASISTWP